MLTRSQCVLVAGLIALLAPGAAAGQPPTRPTAPASQNPSPMVETTRAHERLVQRPFAGTSRTFTGPAGRAVELRVPRRQGSPDITRRAGSARDPAPIDLVIHFHGAAWVAEQAVERLGDGIALAVLNLGAGSGAYHRAFTDPAAFDSLLATIERELAIVTGPGARIGRVTLSGFSAGHGAIRATLLEPRHAARVDAVLLMDGMHTSYVPEGRVLADSGTLDARNLEALAAFAGAAMRGEKRFVVTHSEIFPGTFASTTETADWLVAKLGLRRTPVLAWGPRGMQQLSEVVSGEFALLGYAGNTAPDHIDHFHAMPELLARLHRP
jgi:hypothetical protein